MDGGAMFALALIIAALWLVIHFVRKARRRNALIKKYGSEEIADKIIAKKVWQGMSSEQLIEAWGRPVDMDETVYKTKTKQTWKYGKTGKNRYNQRVTLENGLVVGWQNQ